VKRDLRKWILLAATFWITTACSAAGPEQSRLEADLDGDGSNEVVTMKATRAGDFGSFEIAVGSASYKDKYFAGFGKTPILRAVQLDSRDKTRQIYVSLVWASWCTYQFLAYDGKSLRLLGTLESNHCLYEPKIPGKGEVTIKKWEGFWASTRRFKLAGDPSRLVSVEQRYFDLDISGVARTRFPLYTQDSEKVASYAESGHPVSIRRFDSKTERYLVVDGKTQGWTTITPEGISGLPWAD